MKLEEFLHERSGNRCELSGTNDELAIYEVNPDAKSLPERNVLMSKTLIEQIEKRKELDIPAWESFLTSSIWSEVPAIQVLSWRMLNRLRNESWAAEALDMVYLDDEILEWAKASGDHVADADVELHKDCNGNILINGDTVTLIKDLNVKGSSLNAKIGTAVRNIRLVHDNVEQIEGKIEGQNIVILTKYVKKQG